MRASNVRTAVWCSVDQLELVAGVAACEGIDVIGVCAVDGMRTGQAAHDLGVPPIDDPRQLATIDCDAVWLAADADLAADTLGLIAGRDGVVATALQPATLLAFAEARREAGRGRGAAPPPLPRPAALLSDALLDGAGGELLRQFGRIDGAAASIGAATAVGGIGARVFDVAEFALRALGAPEMVLATFVGDSGGGIAKEDLRGLAGTMSLHVRTESAALAATISTHGGASRLLVLFGPSGRIEADGASMRWLGDDGRMVDELRLSGEVRKRRRAAARHGSDPDRPQPGVASTIAAALRSAAGPSGQARPAVDFATALAICEAARLSCRTRAPESPAALRETLAATPQG